MSADTAPAAMPGEREIARALLDSGINIGTSTWPREQLQDATELARAILDLFAPILAEKELQLQIALAALQKIDEDSAAAIRAQGE